jgi:hypothetical protein
VDLWLSFSHYVVCPSSMYGGARHGGNRIVVRFGLVLNATLNNISAISWQSVFLWRKLDVPVKTTDLSQVTDKLYYIMLHTLKIGTRTTDTYKSLLYLHMSAECIYIYI